jgi:ECF sigma factor.
MNEGYGITNAGAEGGGKPSSELLPLVYEELRRLATRKLAKEPSGHTLQTTA